jgi:putative mRNA 3-end processing factor
MTDSKKIMVEIKKAGHHGILLPQLGIGLDYSGTKAEHIFISHAHADHMPRNRRLTVYCTRPTTKLMKMRGFAGEMIEMEFGIPLETDHARITLYPAGHILGSAMTFVESDLGSVLYTGDYRTPPSPASEGFQLPDRPVDQFITEATFSLPIYKWKSHEELTEQVQSFAREALSDGYTPIFLAYNLGKAQELMGMLKELNHPMQIHGAGFKLCGVYEEEGFNLGNYETYNRETCEGKILIAPSSSPESGFASNVKKVRTAYCSGWAASEARLQQMTVDALIPLSDHLDFFELLDVCEQLNPKKVWITHTPNPKVVQHFLERKGIESHFLDLEAADVD